MYDLYNDLKHYSVGFDQMFKQLENINQTISKQFKDFKYPPFNIVKEDENKYVLEFALAGFGKNNVELETSNNVLTIKGKIETDPELEKKYIYKGISDRAFTRQFALADTVEIKNAELINGILKIWLENIIPESKKPKKVEIK